MGKKKNILHLKNKQFDFLCILNTPVPNCLLIQAEKKGWQAKNAIE